MDEWYAHGHKLSSTTYVVLAYAHIFVNGFGSHAFDPHHANWLGKV